MPRITVLAVDIELAEGEHYAGRILNDDGTPSHDLVLLPGDAEGVTWAKAKEFAQKSGGELPTRAEQSLLFANLKDEFKGTWYWSGEASASYASYAWLQFFDDGLQGDYRVYGQCRARAVRSLIIE